MIIKKSFFAIVVTGYFLTACSTSSISPTPTINSTDITEEKYTWDLSDLYVDLNTWEDARLAVAEQVKALSKLQGTLGESAESLLYASEQISIVYKEVVRIYVHANLRADMDTRNAAN